MKGIKPARKDRPAQWQPKRLMALAFGPKPQRPSAQRREAQQQDKLKIK
jgi:hypothetical protein